MFNPQGGVESKAGSDRIYAKYTGIVNVTPVRFNPTKEELKEITGNEKLIYSTDYYNQKDSMTGKIQSRICLLVKYNPQELLVDVSEEERAKHPDCIYDVIEFRISKEVRKTKGKDKDGNAVPVKTYYINDKCDGESCAIDEKSLPDWFKAPVDDKHKLIIIESREGEATLYNLMYAWYNKVKTKEQSISGFMLGSTAKQATKAFEDICDGDVSALNALFDAPAFKDDEGNTRQFAVLMGVAPSKKTNDRGEPYLNQKFWVSPYVNTFLKRNAKKFSTKVTERLLEGSFQANYGGNYKFQVYDSTKQIMSGTTTIEAPEESSVSHNDISLLNDDMPF